MSTTVGKPHLVDLVAVYPKVKLLIEYGARLDLVDVGPMENTALHLAARFGAVTWPER